MRATIRVRTTGVDGVAQYLARVGEKLHEPEGGLRNAVNRVGAYWQRNYEAEGGLNGGWADLALRTQEDRARQGYPPTNPIMLRYGATYRTSTLFFADAKGPGRRTEGVPYDDRVSIVGILEFDKNTASLSLEGQQVFNHWPGIRNNRPARPIWFVTPAVVSEATQGVFDWLVEEVLK